MPGRFRPPHQSGRRRPPPRVNAEGVWFGMGRQELDEHWGIYWPVQLMVDQDGYKVSAKLKDGSLDMDKDW
jgi:hypothetical protein